MVAALAFLLTGLQAPQTLELQPTDDIWVYPHASDPATDSFLRIFGSEGRSTAETPTEHPEFSYAYLKFDLSKLPKGAKITGATLQVTHIPNPSFTLDEAKRGRLEARPVSAEFSEKDWDYDKTMKIGPSPDPEDFYGSFIPQGTEDTKKDWPININLMTGKTKFGPAAELASETPTKSIAIALCSLISPQELGHMAVWKIYSKEGPEGKRPVLKLTFTTN
ncbi:MAG: hypothetical protein JSS72_12875 [Armatimonadetes bacterium]|nr:hypothetical protein [Armatimonadota bacterium]